MVSEDAAQHERKRLSATSAPGNCRRYPTLPDVTTRHSPPQNAVDGRMPDSLRWHVLLALPFALCALFLLLSGRVFLVFWGSDETLFHWPLILRFARDLPQVDWRYGGTATTPLFHLFSASVVALCGERIQLLRMVNAVVSLGGVLALFGMVRRSRHHPPATAALFTAVFLSSCYFFGYSFRVLTDNMAIVFCILAMSRLYRFAESTHAPRLTSYLWGCLWLSLTVLTRQSYLFLGLPFLAVLLWAPVPMTHKIAGVAALLLAVVPLAALVIEWHGLVPPDFQERHTGGLLNLYAPALPLMLLGIYACFFRGPELYRQLAAGPWRARSVWLPIGAAAAGLAIVATFPLFPLVAERARCGYFPEVVWKDPGAFFAGWFYNIAGRLPLLHGNSILFWITLPAGLVAAAIVFRELFSAETTLSSRLAPLFLLAVLLSSLLNGISAQKYYDGLMLLVLVWHARPGTARDLHGRILLGALILFFCLYYVTYARQTTGT